MRLGVFGGSFDPVHLGHLTLADGCSRQASLDRVLFVPAAQQPLKSHGPQAAGEDRLAMVRLAIADRPKFEASPLELDRGGVSYTVDTLREIHRGIKDAKLFFLMGADALADLPTWREPRAICELATPLVVSRYGRPAPDFSALAPLVSSERLEEIGRAQVALPDAPISSTQIRRLVSEGGPWEKLVPAAVAEYIRVHGLYRRG